MQRLRTLSEAECYARCYGSRSEDAVRIVKVVPRRADAVAGATGELMRLLFEEKLDTREPEAA